MSVLCGPGQDDPGRGQSRGVRVMSTPERNGPNTFSGSYTLILTLGPDAFGNSEFSRLGVILYMCSSCANEVLVTPPNQTHSHSMKHEFTH